MQYTNTARGNSGALWVGGKSPGSGLPSYLFYLSQRNSGLDICTVDSAFASSSVYVFSIYYFLTYINDALVPPSSIVTDNSVAPIASICSSSTITAMISITGTVFITAGTPSTIASNVFARLIKRRFTVNTA